MNALIVGRVLCGVGGGGMYTGVMVLLSFNTSEQERPSYFGKRQRFLDGTCKRHFDSRIIKGLRASHGGLEPVLVPSSAAHSPTLQRPGVGRFISTCALVQRARLSISSCSPGPTLAPEHPSRRAYGELISSARC